MRWFLLNKLFQMRPAEIAHMEGVKNTSAVRGLIIRVSDQLSCGEISLFEKNPEEAEAAKTRLEAKRKQRRERYAKNKEKINAKRREAYVPKKIKLTLNQYYSLQLSYIKIFYVPKNLLINSSYHWLSLEKQNKHIGGSILSKALPL